MFDLLIDRFGFDAAEAKEKESNKTAERQNFLRNKENKTC